MVLGLADAALAVYPLLRSSALLSGKPRRAELLHWCTWWLLWAVLLLVDAATLGWLPLIDLCKALVLVPAYSAQGAALASRLFVAAKRHLAAQPLCKKLAQSARLGAAKVLAAWAEQAPQLGRASWLPSLV